MSSALETVQRALRIKARHDNGGTCERCTDKGCPDLTWSQALTKAGEW